MTQIIMPGAGDVVLRALNTYTGRTYLNEGRLAVAGSGQIGNPASRAGSILVRNGELLLQDSAKIYTTSSTSSVTVDGTIFNETGQTFIGQRTGESGILTVRNNALFDTAADLLVGNENAKGVLNLSDAAQVVANGFGAGVSGYAEGEVIQTGGSIMPGNGATTDWYLGGLDGGSSAASGLYQFSGGVLDAGNQNFQVGRNGTGVVNQSGGTARGTGSISLGRFHSGSGTWTITGGALNATTTSAATPSPEEFLIVGEAGTGTLTVNGTTALVRARSLSLGHAGGSGTVNLQAGVIDLTETGALSGGVQPGVVFSYTSIPSSPLPTAGGTLNLNGGTLKTFSIAKRPGSPAPAIVNLNGGTIMAIGNSTNFVANLDGLNVKAGGAIIDSNGFNVVVNQPLRHDAMLGATIDGGLRKNGAGELRLTAASTYTGPTQVNAGNLNLTSAASLTSSVTVTSGAILSGSGTIDGNVTINGSLQPGSTLGTLTLVNGGLTLAAGSNSMFELGGSSVSLYDRVVGISTLTIGSGGVISVTLANGFQPSSGQTFDLFDFTSSSALGFNPATQLLLPALSAGLSWNKNNFLTNGTITVMVPEPGSAGVFVMGMVGAFGAWRRRGTRR
jgi:autotransporter-associated beta strand protein